MVIEYDIGPDGNAIRRPSAPREAKSKAGTTGKKTSAKSCKPTDWQVAEQAARTFGMPLAFQAGTMWGYSSARGWTDQTSKFMSFCHRLRQRNARASVFEIVADQMAIPQGSPTLYWEREGDIWNGRWVPLYVTGEQVVYADALVNVMTDEVEPLEGRIVYGPMITLSWHTDTGEEPRCPEFEDLIANGLPDPEIRRHFQELAGLVLQPHVHLRGQIVLWGPPCTGKSTIAAAIACAPAGLTGASFISESRLLHDKWSTLGLVNRFASVSNDSEINPRWEAFLKEITSGPITIEPKFRKPESIQTTAKLISTCNQMQSLSDQSGAGSMRLYPFRLDNPIPLTGDPTQPNLGMPRHWCIRERRAGVVQWLLNGLIRLRGRGTFVEPDEYREIRDEALAEANPLEAWVRENIKADPEGWVRLADVIQVIPQDVHESSPRGLETKLGTLIQRLFGIKPTRKSVAGMQQRGYAGVALKET